MIGAGSSYNNVIIGAYNSRIEANGMSYVSILGGANNNIYQDNSFAGVVPKKLKNAASSKELIVGNGIPPY
jgi:hypothetical protein